MYKQTGIRNEYLTFSKLVLASKSIWLTTQSAEDVEVPKKGQNQAKWN